MAQACVSWYFGWGKLEECKYRFEGSENGWPWRNVLKFWLLT